MTASAPRQPTRDPVTAPVTAPAVERVFDHQRIWRLTANVFERGAAMLAACEPVPAVVVGIARGGIPLARFLGGHYGVPVLEITARHNRSDDLYTPATGIVELSGAGLRADLLAGRPEVLVADDICGTGATLREVLPRIGTQLQPSRLRVTTLCRNAAASVWPDSWLWDTRDWVVFPWDTDTSEPTQLFTLPDAVRCGRQA
jgi:hypoxanthine phosphoribosyltransferase